MRVQSEFDVLVVGAGPAGLIIAKHLEARGLSFEVIDRGCDVGGVWDIEAPGSPMYDSAHFISSRSQSGIPGFPMPDHYPDYPRHDHILEYIRAFADTFDLRKHVAFGTTVIDAQQNEDGYWIVTTQDGATRTAKYLVCANGVTWIPNLATWPGQFNGEVRHSITYKSASEFHGKRVLIVGAGNSGADIACDAAFAASKTYLSVRRGYHFIPKHIMGRPTDEIAKSRDWLPDWLSVPTYRLLIHLINGSAHDYGLPKPDHKLFESHPLMNSQILHYIRHGDCQVKADVQKLNGEFVEFVDGTREKIDLIIAATGYKHDIPYIKGPEIKMKDGRPDLYLGMFSRKHENLAILGFLEFASAAYANFYAMAELIAADAASFSSSTQTSLLCDLKRNHFPDLRGGRRFVRSQRHANYVHVATYRSVLNKVKRRIGMPPGT